MRCRNVLRGLGLAAAVVPLSAFLAERSNPSAEAQTYSSDLYDALSWDNVGPARGGRSTAGAGSDARPLEYYFGATGGGLWKTKTPTSGTTWDPVTDGQINSASVGAVQVCEANPETTPPSETVTA